MTRESRLPQGRENIFQKIKKKTEEVQATGREIHKLSIGQPVGSPFLIARVFASLAVMMSVEEIHEYQDNGASGVTRFFESLHDCGVSVDTIRQIAKLELFLTTRGSLRGSLYGSLVGDTIACQRYVLDLLDNSKTDHAPSWVRKCPDFAREFCQFHNNIDFDDVDGLGFLPIPGIKSMLSLIPQACNTVDELLFVGTMTNPGYPIPKTHAEPLGYKVYELPLTSENKFRFSVEDLHPAMDLLMLNCPHNPSGQTVTESWWHEICDYCQTFDIRIFNDATYAKLAFEEHCTLADVAVHYPDLSWAEAYSASKMGCNFTGWRVGAIVGSADFVGDIATVKGNADSGFFAPVAVGVLVATRYEKEATVEYCQTFQRRQKRLCQTMREKGMRLAVEPRATFFNIWQVPKCAFGQEIKDAQHFNYLMIEKGGLIGMHFDSYYRCAVVADIFQEEFISAIEMAFDRASVEY